MSRNIEVKARVKDLELVKQRILHYKSTNTKYDNDKTTILKQKDVFYNLPDTSVGKLKFRRIQAYDCLENEGFIHFKVNHLVNFKDPETGNIPIRLKGCCGGTLSIQCRNTTGFSPELIYYDREESTGPNLSSYHKCNVPEDLEIVLTKALGTWGVVKKNRTLIMVGQTRVHFDNVEDLGDFVELEVVLKDDQKVEEGQCIAKNLMNYMEIEEKDLISVSYVNMLSKK